MFEEAGLDGFLHEMRHFISPVLGEEEVIEGGDDGRETLEIIQAA